MKEIAIPGSLQAAPVVLDVVVFAVVGRVVDKTDLKTGSVGKFDHALKETGSAPTAFWTIVHVDDKALDMSEAFLATIPPKIDAICQKVAGLIAACEEHECFAGLWFQYSSGNQFLLGSHLMVKSLDWLQASGLALSRVVANMDSGFCVHTDTNRVRVQIGLGIYRMDVFEDRVRPFVFF